MWSRPWRTELWVVRPPSRRRAHTQTPPWKRVRGSECMTVLTATSPTKGEGAAADFNSIPIKSCRPWEPREADLPDTRAALT